MADGSIVIDTKIDQSGLDKQLDSLKGSLESVEQQANKAFTVAAAAIGAAGVALFKFTQHADNIDKLSQKIGMSRQTFQELNYAFKQSGIEIGVLQMGMKSFRAEMESAAKGGSSVFSQLGVSATDATGKLRNQDDVMKEALVSLEMMENGTQKVLLAEQLFGRAGTELMPILNGQVGTIQELIDRSHELGLVMSDENVDAGVVFGDTIDDLKQSFFAFMNSVITPLIPLLQTLAEGAVSLTKWFNGLSKTVKGLLSVFSGLSVLFAGAFVGLLVGVKALMSFISAYQALRSLFAAGGLIQSIYAMTAGLFAQAKAAFLAASATQKFNMALKASVIGAVTGLLFSAVSALGNYISKILEANKQQKEFNKILKLSLEQLDELDEKQKSGAIKTLENETKKLKERKEYLERGLANQKKMTNWTSLSYMPGETDVIRELDKLDKAITSAEANLRALKKEGIFADKKPIIKEPIIKVPTIKYDTAEGQDAEEQIGVYDELMIKIDKINKREKAGIIDTKDAWWEKSDAMRSALDRLTEMQFEIDQEGGDTSEIDKEIQAMRAAADSAMFKAQNATKLTSFLLGAGIPENVAYGINYAVHLATGAVKDFVEDVADAFSNAWELFSDVFSFMIDFNPSEMFDNFKAMIDGLIEFFNKDLGSIPIFAQMALNLVKDFISAITNNLPVLIQTIGNVIDEVLNFIVDNADAIVSAFFNIVVAIIAKLAEKFPDIIEAFIKVLLVVLNRLTEIAPEIIQSIITALTEAFVVIAQNAAFIARAVGELIMVIATSLIENFPMIVEALAEGMPQLAVAFAVEFPIAMMKEMPNLIKALIIAFAQLPGALAKGLYRGFRDAGKNLILGLVDGIMKAPGIWESTKKKFSEFIDKIKEFFKMHSPSRVMYDIGRNLIFGLINGIKSAFSYLYEIASSLGSSFMSALGSGIRSAGGLITKYLLDSLQSAVNSLFYNLKDTVWSWIQGWFKNIASGVWGYIKDDVKRMVKKPKKWFGFAKGTDDAPGGLAVVGEEGPELVELPAHSRVYTADETKAMMSVRNGISSLTGGIMPSLSSTPNQTINLNNNLIATIVADGREIGRAAFKYIDKFAGGAYGY